MTQDLLAARAQNLFEFLSRKLLLRETPITDYKKYAEKGMVLWMNDLLEIERLCGADKVDIQDLLVDPTASVQDGEETNFLFLIRKATHVDPPRITENLEEWIDGKYEVWKRPIQIRDSIIRDGIRLRKTELPHNDQLAIDRFEAEHAKWRLGARHADLYEKCHDIFLKSTQQSDEFELVVSIGLLSWQPEKLEVNRHLFTQPVKVSRDAHTGEILFELASPEKAMNCELKAIPAQLLADETSNELIRKQCEELAGEFPEAHTFEAIASVASNALGSKCTFTSEVNPVTPGLYPVISWSPAFIMRERERGGQAAAFQKIANLIEESQRVPEGFLPLVDPNFRPSVGERKPNAGAIYKIDDEIFSPLPLNDKQRKILENVDKSAQTIVQGPPGTGKTHTAAALLSHLLAQGKRVLVTAETERALYELRGKLPEEVRELAVSVIGSSAEDMADLRVSIDTISRRSNEFDSDEAEQDEKLTSNILESLRQQRHKLSQELIDTLEHETTRYTFGAYSGTKSELTEIHNQNKERFDWLKDCHFNIPADQFPLDSAEIETWRRLHEDPQLENSDRIWSLSKIELSDVMDPESFSRRCVEESALKSKFSALSESLSENSINNYLNLEKNDQERFSVLTGKISKKLSEISGRSFQYADDIRHDFATQNHTWESRYEEGLRLVDALNAHVDVLQKISRLTFKSDPDTYFQSAQVLEKFCAESGDLKTDASGNPKVGLFSPKKLKENQRILQEVTINGMPPVSQQDFNSIIHHVQASWCVNKLEALFPTSVPSGEVNAAIVASRFTSILDGIGVLIRLGRAESELAKISCKIDPAVHAPFEEANLEYFQKYPPLELVHDQIINAQQELDSAVPEIEESFDQISVVYLTDLQNAAIDRNEKLYAEIHREIMDAKDLVGKLVTRESLNERIQEWSSELSQLIHAPGCSHSWVSRIVDFPVLRDWQELDLFLQKGHGRSMKSLQKELAEIEERILENVSHLAANRAWRFALGEERINGQIRANLAQYSQLVKKLGKGTGKYAEKRRRDIRIALDGCREAAPVWIMPLHRVWDQFDLQEDMFDVVIVDEASQADVSAIMLQFLAPQIVVISDDRQVSPTSFTDQDELRILAQQYLKDDPYRASWVEPTRSLFDEAVMRYGGKITLTEHRRCVPEIIEFSNMIAYAPDNVRLQPVREVRADRLPPFRIIHTPEGYESGKRQSINQIEADALVDAVVQASMDPDYDGKTFGVISLLSSSGQHAYIQEQLLRRLETSVLEERDLRVGTPSEFQGAERDVIFLSMVKGTPGVGQSYQPATKDDIKQRYNVAVSRAKDQVVLCHSIRLQDLKNENDLRFQLLNYAYKVSESENGRTLCAQVSDTERDQNFDSLFEQRVYNLIVSRGYQVIPQFNVLGYRIDMVVIDGDKKLAIECDGDYWHGPEQATRDLVRQRELERMGWIFVRFFESDFIRDPNATMGPVWDKLDELSIRPVQQSEL